MSSGFDLRGRSFIRGWRVEEITGEIIRVCKNRISIRVRLGGSENVLNVKPENVQCGEEAGNKISQSNGRPI